jgi:hypothetical protein
LNQEASSIGEASQARPFDVDEAEQQALNAENRWVQAQQKLQTALMNSDAVFTARCQDRAGRE